MSGVFIEGFHKPAQCGYHIDRYTIVTTCRLAMANGSCRIAEKRAGKRLSLREQYENCPMQEISLSDPLINSDNGEGK